MQLTFFIGWEIKSPSRSIYLNHASLFRPCRALARPRVSLISRDERDRWGRPFAPVWGVDAGSDATNSCWGRIWGLLVALSRAKYMDPDNIPGQLKGASCLFKDYLPGWGEFGKYETKVGFPLQVFGKVKVIYWKCWSSTLYTSPLKSVLGRLEFLWNLFLQNSPGR